MSKIEWTEATWNPIAGCSVVSPGCTNCYAMRQAHRLASNPATPHYAGTTQMSRGGPVWTGKIGVAPDNVLTVPLRRRKPTTYFVNSMSDLFHEAVPDEVIDRVFAVMALCPQHRFQILTKRPDRMRGYVSSLHAMAATEGRVEKTAEDMIEAMGYDSGGASSRVFEAVHDGLPNVWLGVSIEDQRRADERIPHLLATPAAVRFVSAEPLLGPVDLEPWLDWPDGGCDLPNGRFFGCADCEAESWPPCRCPCDRAHYHVEEGPRDKSGCPEYVHAERVTLDWVIVGGESGPGARPMHPDWARTVRDQCNAAGVPFFFKQWGAWKPTRAATPSDLVDARRALILSPDGRQSSGLMPYPPEAWLVENIGKRAAGRTLDGRLWSEVPA
jgi:protein gp37